MRLGREGEARKELELAYSQPFPRRRHRQRADADGQLQELRHVRNAHHRSCSLNKKEADVLRPYFQDEMLRAMATYEKKYKYQAQ